jgi:monoterpene epsilon-lactone hydrolase
MTISSEADFLRALYKSWSEHMAAIPAMTITELRGLFDEWHQATGKPEGVTYKRGLLAGEEAIGALPVSADTSKVILYTHAQDLHDGKVLGRTVLIL